MASCFNPTSAFEFPPADIAAAVRDDRLLSMEIEFSRRCNFRCPYCYVPREAPPTGELSREEIRDVIGQARDLGARKIIVLGGEPSIYPHLVEMLGFIADQGLTAEMFTNGSGIDAAAARELAARRVRVVLKLNSFTPAIQDRLTGVPGSHKIIHAALEHLREAGYPSGDLFLAASTVICGDNLEEMPGLWAWLRERGIAPYFEVITPQANAVAHPELHVTPPRLERLFRQLSDLDRERFGRDWDPQPPLVGNKCLRHSFSCLVTAVGDVMPCVGVTIVVGNVRRRPLAAILRESQVIRDLKNHRETIKGPCGTCEKAAECYGCRGAAYQLTGDYLASDPLCWLHGGRPQ